MAHLIKRGKVYYARWKRQVNGKGKSARYSLETRHKDVAQKLLKELEKLESLGKIDPFAEGFNPVSALKRFQEAKRVPCKSMREAVNLFLDSKKHRSQKTIDAYEWALDHLLNENDLESVHPRYVNQHHFEKIIFKPGIKETSRHFYLRHFRSFWNFLKKKGIVEQEFFASIREELPKSRVATRPKMLTKREFELLFETFDQELARKKKLPDFDPDKVQYWFKPMICLYMFAGLRKHEAGYSSDLPYSGLKGSNLVFEDGELSYIYLPPTKGRKEREIPLFKTLKQEMDIYLARRGKVARNDYVFRYFGGRWKGRPVSGQVVYKEFKRYLELAGIPESRTLHGLRHRAVTTWIEAGFSTAEAAFLAGHSTQRVTEKYTHLTAKNLKDKMDMVEL